MVCKQPEGVDLPLDGFVLALWSGAGVWRVRSSKPFLGATQRTPNGSVKNCETKERFFKTCGALFPAVQRTAMHRASSVLGREQGHGGKSSEVVGRSATNGLPILRTVLDPCPQVTSMENQTFETVCWY